MMAHLQCWVSMMWFCHHHWFQGTQEVILTLPLRCISYLSCRWLFRHMPPMPVVLHRWASFSEISLPPICIYVGSLLWCMFSTLSSHVDAFFKGGGSNIGVSTKAVLGILHMAGICASWWWSSAHSGHALICCSLNCFEKGGHYATQSAILQPFQPYGRAYCSGAWQRGTQALCLPYMVGRDLLFQVGFYPMTQSTPNWWWVWNLVILVWWLHIRLKSLLTAGGQSILLLDHTFTLGS